MLQVISDGLVPSVAVKKEKPDEIYMIGHDLHSHNDKINNIYKSTKHYTAAENGPTPTNLD